MYQSILVILLLFHCAHSQDANCDFRVQVYPGYTYSLTTPNYPNSYNRNSKCRWTYYLASGSPYNVRIDCTEINMPQGSQAGACNMDRFLISKSGDPFLTSADFYCGQGTVSAVSTGQVLTAGLTVSASSTGGRCKCNVYAQQATAPSCNCGYTRGNRIVGGQETPPMKYTMMAGIKFNGGPIKCGGTIISKDHVLSAAHCMVGNQASSVTVWVGAHNQNNQPQQQLGVSSILIHPQYNSDTYDNDIAILRLSLSIVFNDLVGPACLPFKFVSSDFSGQPVTMLGWGTQFPGGPTSSTLREVVVNIQSQSSCQSSVSTVTPRQRCTYARGKDACQDDSGGPVLYSDSSSGRLFLVGIISFGRFCASEGNPGICTWIPAFLNWITQNAPADYCYK